MRDRPAGDSGGVEALDDARRHDGKIPQCRDNPFAVHRREINLVEDYVEGRCYLGLRCISGEFEQYGFVFQAAKAEEAAGILRIMFGNEHAVGARVKSDQPFVLPLNIETVKRPEIGVPSLVWVERFDDSFIGLREPLFIFYPLQWIDEVVLGPQNRKMRSVVGRYAIATGQRCGKDIEAASERVDDGTSLGVDDERKRNFLARYHHVLAGIRIGLLGGYLYARRMPGQEPSLHGFDLGYGPIDSSLSI